MLLVQMQVSTLDGDSTRGVSVWVNDNDPDRASERAIAALANAGWRHVETTGIEPTQAEDYFRTCPSQQAFVRAQSEQIAWRFDDE